MGTGSFPGIKRPGRDVDHPPPSSAEVKERVELCLYSPLVACSSSTFTFSSSSSSSSSSNILGGIKENENYTKRYDIELVQLLADLDILSLVRTVRLNWIGCVNRMDSARKVSQVFNVNLQGSSSSSSGSSCHTCTVIIATVTIHHQLDLTRPVSTSSNSHFFKGLPSRLLPFGL